MKLQRLLGAICAGLMLISLPVRATEQASYVTPGAGPMSMATFVTTYLNPAMRALAACHNGSSAPANGPSSLPMAYQEWCDTTTNPAILKRYDGTSWVSIGSLNTSTHVWLPYLTGGTSGGVPYFSASGIMGSSAALAQYGFVVGGGAGAAPATITACTDDQIPFGRTSNNPLCRSVTGDVTFATGASAIGANKVTNAMFATMAATTTKCNATGGSAVPTDCSASTMRTNMGVVIGTNVQAWDADLDALAALSGTNTIYYRSAANTWTAATFGTSMGFSGGAITRAALTGDVTASADSNTTVLGNIPTGVTMAGSLLATAIAAPSTPAAGKASIYVDSTSKNLAAKNDAGTVNHGIQSRTATTSNWIRSIADDGTTAISQPAIGDISGLGTNVAAALGINIGSGGALVQFNGAGGTPSSMTGTNISGTAAGLTAGNVTTNANLTGDVTSVGNATTLTNAPVIAKLLTAFAAGAGTVTSSDSILTAFQKIVGNIALKLDAANSILTGTSDNQGTLKLSSFVTSTQITTSQNNYTATDGSNTCTTKTALKISSNGAVNITGLSCAQAEGDIRIIHNVGTQTITLKNSDAGSTAANQLLLASDVSLPADYSIALRYDDVIHRWRPLTTPGAGGGGGGTVTIAGAGLNTTSGTCNGSTGTCTITAAMPKGYWNGCQHSNNGGTPNTKIDVGACSARDGSDAINIVKTSGTIDLGTVGANGLDAGSLANAAFYYTFVIEKSDLTAAFVASTSSTSPTLPSGYSYSRRIGAFKTDGSAHVLPFTHVNNHWWLTTAIRDVSTSSQSTSFISYVLSVPRIQGVLALYSITYFASSAITVNVMPGFLPSTAAAGQSYFSPSSSGSTEITQSQVDSFGQIQIKSTSASTTITVDLAGWIDNL